jgi:hypothetical protein
MARGQARLKKSFAICERREARMNGRIALGEYGEQLVAEIEKKIAEDDGEVVLLPVSRE